VASDSISPDLLRIVGLTKAFRKSIIGQKNIAVNNITVGVKAGEVRKRRVFFLLRATFVFTRKSKSNKRFPASRKHVFYPRAKL
jgi:hypothetical protein